MFGTYPNSTFEVITVPRSGSRYPTSVHRPSGAVVVSMQIGALRTKQEELLFVASAVFQASRHA